MGQSFCKVAGGEESKVLKIQFNIDVQLTISDTYTTEIKRSR